LFCLGFSSLIVGSTITCVEVGTTTPNVDIDYCNPNTKPTSTGTLVNKKTIQIHITMMKIRKSNIEQMLKYLSNCYFITIVHCNLID
jgi:hypothetical protein